MKYPVQHAATHVDRMGIPRIILASLLSLVLFFGLTGVFVYAALANQVKSQAIDISTLTPKGKKQQELPADQFEGRALNILVSGIDSRYDQSAGNYGDPEELVTIQSDTTMVAHISADRKTVTVVSIPRDLITDIPSCTHSDGTTTWEYTGMFNSAFATGAVTNDIAGGIACTKATVEQLTGLTIDAFTVVDFSGFQNMVSALGGVWLDVEEDIDDDSANAHLKAGCQKLDAVQAFGYARVRYGAGDGSDLSRIGRQQKLVSAMFRELLSKNFVTDFPALVSFLQSAISSLSMSTNLSDINADAGLLLSLMDIERANIRFVTMPNHLDDFDSNRVRATEPDASALWQALASDGALPAGLQYTDGNGQLVTVPDPPAEASTAPTPSEAPEGMDSAATTPPAESPTPPETAAAPSPDPAPQPCPPQR
ncbi:LCP family protein [Schaalia sp. ZJ405]|uniref:LCP family protein n=1 Tax=Schaalia sp. ZJ405 TaxID=2709403 RepID=UPI0013EBAAF5|nr:LCP family protein [Schaalia sp. ZJ405]QPK81695.1 LCP family protein [Schaalia sp. ZJ405]